MRLSRALTIGFLIGCALAFVSARPQNQNLSLQDRVLRNEIYLETLSGRVTELEHGGSVMAISSSRDIAVMQQQLNEIHSSILEFKEVLKWIIGLMVAFVGGILTLGIRYFLDRPRIQWRHEGEHQ